MAASYFEGRLAIARGIVLEAERVLLRIAKDIANAREMQPRNMDYEVSIKVELSAQQELVAKYLADEESIRKQMEVTLASEHANSRKRDRCEDDTPKSTNAKMNTLKAVVGKPTNTRTAATASASASMKKTRPVALKKEPPAKKSRTASMCDYLDDVCKKEDGWVLSGSSSYLKRRVRRFFKNTFIDCTVVAHLPKHKNHGIDLWHILHDDGDTEDLERAELERGLHHFDSKAAVFELKAPARNSPPAKPKSNIVVTAAPAMRKSGLSNAEAYPWVKSTRLVGKQVRRGTANGVVKASLLPERNAGIELFRVAFDDGGEEDWLLADVEAGIAQYHNRSHSAIAAPEDSATATAGDTVLGGAAPGHHAAAAVTAHASSRASRSRHSSATQPPHPYDIIHDNELNIDGTPLNLKTKEWLLEEKGWGYQWTKGGIGGGHGLGRQCETVYVPPGVAYSERSVKNKDFFITAAAAKYYQDHVLDHA